MELFELAAHAKNAISNDEVYLTSFMTQLVTRADEPVWSLHFYDPLADAIYTYDAQTGEVRGPDEVLKEGSFIPELEIGNVTVSFSEAIDSAYEAALPETAFVRVIILLQVLDEVETWNVTFMNERFHSLNVRIDATSGRIISKEPFELFGFDSGK
jgi:hypothetical protein